MCCWGQAPRGPFKVVGEAGLEDLPQRLHFYQIYMLE